MAAAHFEQFARPDDVGSDKESDKLDKKPRGRPRKTPSPGPSRPAEAPPSNGPKYIPTPAEKPDQKRREKVESKLKNYEKEYEGTLIPRPWTPGVTPVEELEKIAQDYGNQITGLHQFHFGKMVFLRAADKLPSVMHYVYPDMDLTNLGPATAKNYDAIFEPTWKELIIKYDLFRFGPELRMIFIIQDFLRLVDAKNKENYKQAQAPKDSKFQGL